MHFKRLEICGFKSFAERTVLDFEPGVTAVVGPNGCGKSNIADAIKWGLGEQRPSSLRGSRMEDVIFNGTAEQDPVNFAEVSVTFQNESKILPIEFDEVTITRRLFRSGDSEYLINKQPVRLRDIQELLMGTGIGTDSYSMIEQGKMDQVLSAKPEERRHIFEEASGITRYKAKKREAMRRLDQTEQNILRINDIIGEVGRQIRSVERQAVKAQRYRERYDSLKDLELKLGFLDHRERHANRRRCTEQVQDWQTTLQSEQRQVAELAQRITALRSELMTMEDVLRQETQQIAEVRGGVETRRNRMAINGERIEELDTRIVTLTREIDTRTARVMTLQEETQRAETRYAAVAAEEEQQRQELVQHEQRLQAVKEETVTTDTAVQRGKQRQVELAAEQANLRTTLAHVAAEEQGSRTRLRRLEVELEESSTEFETVEQQCRTAEAGCDEQRRVVERIRGERDHWQTDEARHQQLADELTEQQELWRVELTSSTSKLEVLEEAQRRHEGFSRGVRQILDFMENGESQLPGLEPDSVSGSIAQLIRVESGYEAAIETVLGEAVQTILVRDLQTAQMLMDYLRREDAGRASFLPVEVRPETHTVGGECTWPSPRDTEGLVPAFDVVQCDERWRDALKQVFANIWIAKDLDSGLAAYQSGRVVTRSGELLEGTRVTGGMPALSEGSSLLGRRAMIDRLQSETEKLRGQLEEGAKALDGHRAEIEASRERLRSCEQGLREAEIELASRKSHTANIAGQRQRMQDEVELVTLEIDEVQERLTELETRQTKAQRELDEAEEAGRETDSVMARDELRIGELGQDREAVLIEIAALKSTLEGIEERTLNLARTRDHVRDTHEHEVQDLDARNKQRTDAQQNLVKFRAEVVQLGREVDTESLALSQAETAFEERRTEREQRQDEVQSLEEQLEGRRETASQAKDEIQALEVTRNELDFELRSLGERIRDRYQIELDSFHVDISENFQEGQARVDVEQLRDRVEKMGNVNLAAMEEHDELTERYEFLTTQMKDLIDAKTSLMKAIEKINVTTREIFLSTFEQVKIEFANYFKVLFGGGEGRIYLVDEQNVLESGIEVDARPPGKRLQTIGLLSGGERALSAIALLFALFKVHPSPFCVLDEIDAPLDDANVTRFSRLLKEFVRTSQFIIITHNKKTITMSDAMYGITMERTGMSKIVSVRFKPEAEEDQPVKVTAER